MLISTTGVATADSSTPDAASPSSENSPDLAKGLKVLDTLQDIKAISDQRLADCNTAIGDPVFCKCVNDRFTLELSFVDYVAMVTLHTDDKNNPSLSADKLKYLDEAKQVREICAVKNNAAPGNH